MLLAVRIWILFSALLVATGWILSALHQLNKTGYGLAFATVIFALFLLWEKIRWRSHKNIGQLFQRFHWRFKRAAPLFFLILTVLVLIGGSLYSPFNSSSASYRIPRVMHWLAENQWHWIRTPDIRANVAECGYEWLSAPLILFSHTDRLLFLPNWIAFLTLPGLIFSVFTRMGVQPRAAWWWMWLLPLGWCFILQAGSTLNDSFGAAYGLAAVDFALRAKKNNKIGDLWLAILAAALAIGVKQTNIMLAALAFIAILPAMKLLLKRPLSSLAVIAAALLVSALPMIIINWRHTGSWSGVSMATTELTEMSSPFWGFVGNIFCFTVQNLKPPVFPFVNSWNNAMQHFIQTPFGKHFNQFEDFGHLSFGAGESSVALGPAILLLAVISILAAIRYRPRKDNSEKHTSLWIQLLKWTPWLLLIIYLAKVGTYENGRQFASYYFFLFPAVLAAKGHSVVVKKQWWKISAIAVLMIAILLLVVSKDRPLFPAQTIIAKLQNRYPDSKFVISVNNAYKGIPAFEDERRILKHSLPDDAVLGFAAKSGANESPFWLPFGSRRVIRILPDDTPAEIRAFHIRHIVIEDYFLRETGETIQQWLVRNDGTLIQRWEFIGNPQKPSQAYYLVQLRDS